MNSLIPSREAFFAPINEEFNRLFDRLFSTDSLQSVRSKIRSGYPKMDLIETTTEFVVEVELPGVNEEDLTCEILPPNDATAGRKVLRLNGKKDYNYQYPEGTSWHVKELRRSQFTREVVLPENVEDSPEATYDRGILRLVFNKKEADKKLEAKLIPIVKKA
jgi:HSP20 family protein